MVLTDGQQNIKEGIEGRPASWYSEIIDHVFPNLDREQARRCKICEWKKEHGSKDSNAAESE